MKFIDLFAGLGGFHKAMKRLGHECIFASEIDDELRVALHPKLPRGKNTFGDIRKCRDEAPRHVILCAGFPCQPFSKSGSQLGVHDKIQGTLFDEIVYILDRCRPEYVILENVGNFERHDGGRTWQIVREKLQKLEYDVRGTEHITSGGPGLISPAPSWISSFEREIFIVATQGKLPANPFPLVDRQCVTSLNDIVQSTNELTEKDRAETCLTASQRECIDHWNLLLSKLPEDKVPLPSFPIWGDEIDAIYPFEDYTPYVAPIKELRECLNGHVPGTLLTRRELLQLLPSYARIEKDKFPKSKIDFIRQNREWYETYHRWFPKKWVESF